MKILYLRDTLLCLVLLVIAALPRLILLNQIPPGLHGDEGWTGIDAARILAEGPIGPYVGSALGQPTGPLYLTAFIFRLLGESIFSLRFSMSVFGILTIPLFYLLLRTFFQRNVSFLTSLALSFSLYHLHYSRIGFMLISAPFFQLLALTFLFLSEKRGKLSFLILSAIFTALGLYSYNTFAIFPFTIIAYLIFNLCQSHFHKTSWQKLSIFLVAFTSFSLPLLLVVIQQPDFYFSHYQSLSILNHKPLLAEDSLWEKALTIATNGWNNIFHFFAGKRTDFADAFGQFYNFNISYLVLFLIGIIYALKQRTKHQIFLALSLLFFLTTGLLTVQGLYRRQILSIVILYFFLAVALNFLLRKLPHQKTVSVVILVIIVLESILNLKTYFWQFPTSRDTQYVFTPELTQVNQIIKDLSLENSKVFFFSGRWGCLYETNRFLSNNQLCEDRSVEFGTFSLEVEEEYQPIFVLLQPYLYLEEEIRKKYPEGKKYLVKDLQNKETLGIVYHLK